jgi:hypothetical protein
LIFVHQHEVSTLVAQELVTMHACPGHASIAITKDVYGHLLEGDKRAAAESMSRALFGG